MTSKRFIVIALTITITFALMIAGCDEGSKTTGSEENGGGSNDSITITMNNLPENGEAVVWLSTGSNDSNTSFFLNLKAGGTATVSGNTGVFLLYKPTADLQGFTNEKWTEEGSFYIVVAFGEQPDGQWARSWGSPSTVNINDGVSISASGWTAHQEENSNGNNEANPMQVYNMDGTPYNGSGDITAFNGSNNTLNHGTVGQITDGIMTFSLPASIPDNELHGGEDPNNTTKVSTFVLVHNDMNIWIAKLAENKIIYLIYTTDGIVYNGDDEVIDVSAGWNMLEATMSPEGAPILGERLSDNLEDLYELGYQWFLLPVGGSGGEEE